MPGGSPRPEPGHSYRACSRNIRVGLSGLHERAAAKARQQQLAELPRERQVQTAARFRPCGLVGLAEGAGAAIASVARRHQALSTEIARLDALEELIQHAAPQRCIDYAETARPAAASAKKQAPGLEPVAAIYLRGSGRPAG